MKTTKRFEVLCWALALVPLILVLAAFPFLPQRIPMHWNAAGRIDGWGGKLSAFWLPVGTLLLNVLFLILPKIDPKRKNYASFSRAYQAFRLIFNLFMLVMCAITLYSAFYPEAAKLEKLMPALMGILFCTLGNYMPKFKHNYFVGIKTPWALASETVWRSTHRLGGAVWFVGGLAIIAADFLAPAAIAQTVFISITIGMVAVPTVWSYLCWKKEQAK